MRHLLILAVALFAGCGTTLTATIKSEENAEVFFVSRDTGTRFVGNAAPGTPLKFMWDPGSHCRDTHSRLQFWLINFELKRIAIAWMDSGDTANVISKKYRELSPQEEAAARRQLAIGQTRQEVIAAWGQPSDPNIMRFLFSLHGYWTYGKPPNNLTYVYFTRGLVTDWTRDQDM